MTLPFAFATHCSERCPLRPMGLPTRHQYNRRRKKTTTPPLRKKKKEKRRRRRNRSHKCGTGSKQASSTVSPGNGRILVAISVYLYNCFGVTYTPIPPGGGGGALSVHERFIKKNNYCDIRVVYGETFTISDWFCCFAGGLLLPRKIK